MKHWQETREILRRLAEAVAAERAVAVATVVHIEGSAYRRPGAKLLIEASGTTVGGVSGGCLEADVRDVALGVMRDHAPSLCHYDTGSDENTVWGLGLGCDGKIDVFVQPVTFGAMDVWNSTRELLEGNQPFALSTVVSGAEAGGSIGALGGEAIASSTGNAALDRELASEAAARLAAAESRLETIGSATVFTEVLHPPPWLVILGAGDDAMPLARLASLMGFHVAVADHRSAYLTEDRFPSASRLVNLRPDGDIGGLALGHDCYTVVMTHSLAHDREWVRRLLDSPVAYIGVLGPRTRVRSMLDKLGAAGSHRVFGPVGLDLGADGPEQIALSVLAEALAVRSCRQLRHLRERSEPIHAD